MKDNKSFIFYNLSFFRFSAHFRVQNSFKMPVYTGNIIRSVLGRAMHSIHFGMKEACITCPIRSECRYSSLYAYLFESPFDHPFIKENDEDLSVRYKRKQYPKPFLFCPPPGGYYVEGEDLEIVFSLIGRAISVFPFMVCALEEFAKNGILKRRSRIILEKILWEDVIGDEDSVVMYDSSANRIRMPDTNHIIDTEKIMEDSLGSILPSRHIRKLKVRFLTPFRYKHKNRLGVPLTFEIFVKKMLERLTLLSVHKKAPNNAGTFVIEHRRLLSMAGEIREIQDMSWFELKRYSSSQKDYMILGGYIGTIQFEGEIEPFMPLINICEYVQIGSKISFGFGKYEATVLDEE